VLPSFDLRFVAELLVVAAVLLVAIAALLGGLTVRGARTATLRDNA
jgi:hypothetical protein